MSSRRFQLWIVYSSRKGGHTYPCKAIYDFIRENFPERYIPRLINLLDFSKLMSIIDALGRYGDLKLRRVYKYGYKNLRKKNPMMLGSYRFVQGILYSQSRTREKLIHLYGKPDFILSVQPEINAIARILRGWFQVPFHTAIIDLAVHGLWIDDNVDHYYVANELLKDELLAYQVAEDRITVSGMPIRNSFSLTAKRSRTEIKQTLGLRPGLPAVLIMGGLLGTMIDFYGAVESILKADFEVQIIVVCGKNREVFDRLNRLKSKARIPLHIYGTVSNIDQLMWASEVVVSKPGSVTISEALSLSRPLVVISPRAGSAQELRFAQFIKENGAGEWLRDVHGLGFCIKEILQNRKKYEGMCSQAKLLGGHSLQANSVILEQISGIFNN